MTTPQEKTRPGGLTLIVVLAYIGFLYQIFMSIVTLMDADKLSEQFRWGLTQDQLVAWGILGIVVGVIGVLLTGAFARGSNVVRILFAVWIVFQVAGGFLGLRIHDATRPSMGVLSLVIGIVILYLLFNPRANDYFAKD
ncbi:MAG: hypothetical protein ACKOVH_12635 [Actinomycetota bacterium]